MGSACCAVSWREKQQQQRQQTISNSNSNSNITVLLVTLTFPPDIAQPAGRWTGEWEDERVGDRAAGSCSMVWLFLRNL
jgi:hypothetical protein